VIFFPLTSLILHVNISGCVCVFSVIFVRIWEGAGLRNPPHACDGDRFKIILAEYCSCRATQDISDPWSKAV